MANWHVDPAAGSSSYTGDSWTLALIGTDGQTYGTTKFTSASGGFTGTEGRLIRIASTLKKIVAVVSDTEVTLDSTYSSGTGRSFWIGGAVASASNLSLTTYGAPGDVVKYAKTGGWSPAGMLTYTSKSESVGMGTGRIAIIDDCESGWTGAVNVTATQDTAATYLACGSYTTKLVIASAFTTGKIACKDLGEGNELDLSAFQGISLIMSIVSASVPANSLKICLCSDATGDVVVDTLHIQGGSVFYNAGMRAVKAMRDGGGNLGSQIRSIALYAEVDPSTPTIYLDNIVAIKSLADANHICHHCILSQGNSMGDVHWGILGFPDATHITLTGQWYGGTEGDVSSYKVEPLVWSAAPVSLAGMSGATHAAPLINSGGWDPATDVQDGITSYTYQPYTSSYDYPVSLPTSYHNVKITNWLFAACGSMGAYRTNWTFEDCGWVGWLKKTSAAGLYAYYSSYSVTAACSYLTLRRCWFAGIPQYAVQISNSGIADTYEDQLCDWYWEDVTIYSCTGIQTGDLQRFRGKNIALCNSHNGSGWKGWHLLKRVLGEVEIVGFTLKDNSYSTAPVFYVNGVGTWKIWNLVASGNGVATFEVANHKIHLYNAQIDDTTPYTDIQRSGEFVSLKSGGVPDSHSIANWWGTIVSDSTTRHTGSGIAWKFSPTNSQEAPIRHRLAQVAAEGGVATTIGVYMRRDNAGISGKLFVSGGQLAGMEADLSDAIAVAENQWELVSVSFTASETGVVDVWVEVGGGTSYNLWIDDFSVVV